MKKSDSMTMAGFRYILLMGDNGGNQAPLKNLAPKLDERYRAKGIRGFYSSDAYAKSAQEAQNYLKDLGFPPSRHAGVSDTS